MYPVSDPTPLHELKEPVESLVAAAGSNALAPAEEILQALLSLQLPGRNLLLGSSYSPALARALGTFLEHPAVTADLALQTVLVSGDLVCRQGRVWVQASALEHLQRWWHSHDRCCDALGFARLWAARCGHLEDWLQAFGEERWGRVWPQLEDGFLASYVQAMTPRLLDWKERYSALRLLSRLPEWPSEVVNRLGEAALDEPRRERELAQQALQQQGLAQARVLQALRHAQAGPRQRAAEWAGRMRLEAALKPLTEALAKEKSERTRMAQMEALRLLGAPLDVYLNRPALLAEARKRLAKESPEWLAEMPLADLHWEADGQAVEQDLMRGWLLSAVRLKQAEPGGLFAVVSPYLREGERQQWGLQLLQWWIARDTKPTYTPAQIEQLLPQQTRALQNLYQMLKQSRSDASIAGEARRQLELEVEGSAIELKGLFSLAGALAGAVLLEPVRSYLKKWYGLRAAQCKALLCMLGPVEGTAVVQYLLEVARRFRTKGIQQEAQRVLRERAERQGWTLEELADLSLSSGGLEEKGRLEFEVGERLFSATLLPDLSWRLQDDQGKAYKALPAEAKEAIALFKAAQKAVKEAQKALRERLYEAMCCGRSWNWSAWQNCLWHHPVASRVVSTLVWLARREEEVIAFRPDGEGSLLDVNQDTVSLGDDWSIELAHPLLLSNADWTAWRIQLADYQLLPLFAQLSRSCKPKPPAEPEVMEFSGHVLDSFRLRNRAQALGYQRGPAEDGGVFFEYHKAFVSSGWVIRLGFTGSQLPETSHPVALQSLGFGFQNRPVTWAEVPPALYSESLADVEEIAREGSGFDPDWQSRVTIC